MFQNNFFHSLTWSSISFFIKCIYSTAAEWIHPIVTKRCCYIILCAGISFIDKYSCNSIYCWHSPLLLVSERNGCRSCITSLEFTSGREMQNSIDVHMNQSSMVKTRHYTSLKIRLLSPPWSRWLLRGMCCTPFPSWQNFVTPGNWKYSTAACWNTAQRDSISFMKVFVVKFTVIIVHLLYCGRVTWLHHQSHFFLSPHGNSYT